MGRVNINLYPGSRGEENKIRKFIFQYFPYVFAGVVGVVILNILLAGITIILSLPYRQLSKKWRKIESAVAGIDSLKRELDTLRSREDKYKSFLQRPFEVAHILADIFSALPRNIWFDEISFKDGEIKLSGYVVEWKMSPSASFDKFIKNLRKEAYFSTYFPLITPRSQRNVNIAGKKAMRFELECRSSK